MLWSSTKSKPEGERYCWECRRKEKRPTGKHKKKRESKHTLMNQYRSESTAWRDAKRRCTNPNCKKWERYGGRGITMCDEWMNSFEQFFAYIGPKPTSQHSLDRIDNDGNYEPGNVRWATKQEQARNTGVGVGTVIKVLEQNGFLIGDVTQIKKIVLDEIYG